MPASLITATKFHSTLANGEDNAAGQVFTYAAGTTTPQATYTSAAQTTPNANPIILDATGRASVWLDPNLSYKFVIQDAGGAATPDGTVDNITAATGGAVSDALAQLADATKGAALVAYDAAVEYPANTVGGELRTIQSQVSHMWRRIRTNQSDVNILVLGDSTGNAIDEWVYLMAQWLATECPTHTIKYRLFGLGSTVPNGGTDTWGSYTTLQTGSGPMPPDVTTNTINIDNASVSGTNTNYVEGGREATIWGSSDYDLVIFNFGHNTGTDTTEEIAQPEFMTAVCNARLHAPRAGVLVTLQNFRTSTSGKAQSFRMWNAWRNVASQMEAGVIDVGTAFLSVPDVSIYMADETHPNALGQLVLWLPQVQRAMAEPRNYTGEDPGSYSPFSLVRPCYTTNPRFSSWTATNPDNWTFASCTTAKDTGKTEGTAYSLRITNGAGLNPQITQDISGQLARLKGRTAVIVARIWRSAGMDLLAGRVGITSNNGFASVSATSYPRSLESAGGWEWVEISIPVQSDATSLTVVAYTGAGDGSDNGKQIWFDSIGVFESSQPGAVSLDDVWRKTVLDFYSDGNVGFVAPTTGTLTAVGGTITLSGATSPNSGAYINLPGLVAGQQYKFTWTTGVSTGALGGGLYMRNGFNGGSVTFDSATWTDSTAGSKAFTAPAGPVSIWIYGYTGVTDWVFTLCSIKPVASGIATPSNLPLNTGKNENGTTLTVAAPSGGFGITNTPGTATFLIGESAQGNTRTSAATWEVQLPGDYVAGRDLTLTANAYFSGTGTAGATKSLTLTAYRISNTTGGHGSNLGPSAITLTNTATDYPLTIAGTTLSPGDRLLLRLTAVLQETGAASPINSRINSARLS